ncbi:NUDIX hydrolase [Ochrovirga pacifica]|uniref:NUDIX hydrolase n=1 Tax=Ochrovirga pacifica TaxID=1042376 RepID=UPI0002559AE7|nr:NUDIX domain-containing protein [Ochrovirga pacifica]
MDELIDIVNLKGQPTGNACMKSFAHQNGILHGSVHLWCYNTQQQILVQKRKASKTIFPNLWDVSVAGHIASGELPLSAVIRETQEEIGLSISAIDLEYLGIWEDKHSHANGIIDHEIHHLFVTQTSVAINELTLQKEEVEEVQWLPIDVLKEKISRFADFVPHPKAYYQFILQQIQERF